MEIYERAYNRYIKKCERFGIQHIDITDFMQSVTEQQAQMMLNEF